MVVGAFTAGAKDFEGVIVLEDYCDEDAANLLRMPKFATESEEIFATYLVNRGLSYEYEKSSGTKKPDFWVNFEGNSVVCEVKEINAPPPPNPVGFIDPYRKPINAIVSKAIQGVELEGKCPYLVVIRKHAQWPFDEVSVPGAMFGSVQEQIPIDTRSGGPAGEAAVAFKGDGVLRPGHNSVVSAVAVMDRVNPTELEVSREIRRRLAQVEKEEHIKTILEVRKEYTEADILVEKALTPYLMVFHNPFASVPIPVRFFTGPYDRQWNAVQNRYQVVTQGRDAEKLDDC